MTNEEYAKFDESHSFPAGHGKYPVTNVSYEDATAYCALLSSKSDALFRLPTEDEWELAAGRGDGGKGVKGGSWDSHRMSCRTEYREEGRTPSKGYKNVGFRIIKEIAE